MGCPRTNRPEGRAGAGAGTEAGKPRECVVCMRMYGQSMSTLCRNVMYPIPGVCQDEPGLPDPWEPT
jgi:hypothetical protein